MTSAPNSPASAGASSRDSASADSFTRDSSVPRTAVKLEDAAALFLGAGMEGREITNSQNTNYKMKTIR